MYFFLQREIPVFRVHRSTGYSMGNKADRGQQKGSAVAEPDDWIDRELAKTEFCDERLGKRLRSLLHRLAAIPGQGIPLACQDWASTKAAYRFLDNNRVSEAETTQSTRFSLATPRMRLAARFLRARLQKRPAFQRPARCCSSSIPIRAQR